MTGDTKQKDRITIVDDLENGKVSVLIATGQLIGEGFDCKKLSSLFIATPMRFAGRVTQYIGRVLRPSPGKNTASIYDYVDVNVEQLVKASKSRAATYRKMGATFSGGKK